MPCRIYRSSTIKSVPNVIVVGCLDGSGAGTNYILFFILWCRFVIQPVAKQLYQNLDKLRLSVVFSINSSSTCNDIDQALALRVIGSVCGELLAMTDAEAVVRELLTQVVAEQRLEGPVEVHALSSGGGNYTSALFTASIGDVKLFAKVGNIGEKMRAIMNAEVLYKTEQTVYNELAKTYSELVAKHVGVRPFRFPKIYATLPDMGRETLVMENFTAQGYQTPSRHISIDWRFASAAVTKLAEFHALSFAYEKENPEEFAKMAERLKYRSQKDKPGHEEAMRTTWERMVGGAIQVVKEEHKPKLLKILTVTDGFAKFKTPINRTVLAHGDYRASNLLYKEQDGSLDIQVVDYQMVHSGCPVSDLLYFIFLGTDQQFRRSHYHTLLELYHQQLSAALDRLGLDVEEVYSKQVFEEEVKKMLPSALLMAVVILPVVVVDETAAPNISGDGELSEFAIAPSDLFAERFAALVDDCLDWGVI